MKIKTDTKIKKECTHCFTPTHLKFNFSFITYMDNFEEIHKAHLIDRILELSKEPYLVVSNWPKNIGFEYIRLDISKDINPDFFKSSHRVFDGKYHVIRLYTNNNPLPSRIIGKIIRNVFYIFFIDINGDLYNH